MGYLNASNLFLAPISHLQNSHIIHGLQIWEFISSDFILRKSSLVLLFCTWCTGYSIFFFIRLEEKLTNLESENQVLRQQALSIAPNKFLSGRSRSIIQVLPETINT